MTRAFAIATCCLILTACAPAETSVSQSNSDVAVATALTGTWQIASVGGVKVTDPSTTRMAFTGTTIEGGFGCNSFSGPYTMNGTVITPGPLAVTKMACEGDVAKLERDGLRHLQTSMGVIPERKDRLVLSGPTGQSFILVR